MTHVIIGTYRARAHIEACLASMDRHLVGVEDLVFIDDSGNDQHVDWLAQYGKVVALPRAGYTAAMKAACTEAAGRECFWMEEDFAFTERVDLGRLSEILYHRPYLAQVAVLRGPHFPLEHAHGGLLEALKVQGHNSSVVRGVIEQTATFTTNPSLWRAAVWKMGWPDGPWSENRKRDELLTLGYRFGFLPGIKVTHTGVRSGHGY